jgi:hypothetical protein
MVSRGSATFNQKLGPGLAEILPQRWRLAEFLETSYNPALASQTRADLSAILTQRSTAG